MNHLLFIARRAACFSVVVSALAASRVLAATPVLTSPSSPAPSSATKPAAIPAPEVLPNGATLVMRRDNSAPRVAISILVRAGAADETPATAGWRRLLSEAMLRAVSTDSKNVLNAMQLQRAAEKLGGSIGISVGDDVIEIWGNAESSSQAQLLQLMLAVAQQPRLSDDDLEAARKQTLARLDEDNGQISARAAAALEAQLYRDKSGQLTAYGLPSGGTDESLSGLSGDKLRELHASYFEPSHFVVAVAGDVNEAGLRQTLGQGAANQPFVAGTRPDFAPPKAGQPPLIVKQMRGDAAWVVAGYPLANLVPEDAPALRVLAAALSDSPRARLTARLMGKVGADGQPQVAQVAAQFSPRRFGGELIVFAQTGAGNIETVKNALLDEVHKLRDADLSAGELEAAKNFARGTWAVEREGLRERAFQAGLAVVQNAPADASWPGRVQSVSAADVRRVAHKYLDSYAVALVMPQGN